ncbi:MAG: capsular biosynthesis protein, partial [Bacteroidetes bacterium]|nr:capsular biosynthesis protein [Bacteroidota bacterium]
YEMGYRKFIITPHVMTDFYKNSPETIIECCNKLRVVLKEHNIDVAIEPSAEYYLDEGFSTLIKEKKLLSFGKPNYVLVETNYMEKTNNFFDLMFQLKLAGYTPILAHPERYLYLYDDFSKYEDIFEREILFQVNLMSLCGYYSPMALKIAKKLMEKNMIHFIGSDIHSPKHLVHLQKSIDTKLFKQIAALPLLNNSLL